MNKTILFVIGIVFLAFVGTAYFAGVSTSKPSENLTTNENPAQESENIEASPFGGHVHALTVNGETNDVFLGARPVYRSNDGGKNWESLPVPKLEPRANITSVTADPKNPQIMYATGHGIAVVKSTDGGDTWETKEEGLGGVSTEAFTIDANDSNKLYVWVLGDGMYRSENSGESWGRVDDGPKDQEIRSLASMNVPTGMGGIWLYAGTDTGVIKSPDCFCGWDKLPNEGLPAGRVYSVVADNNNPGTLYAGMRNGVHKSTDEGKTWRQVTDVTEDAIVAVHPNDPTIVYTVGSDGKLFVSNDAGENWKAVKNSTN